jgi:SPP1 family predicted phage head-tail adaptor
MSLRSMFRHTITVERGRKTRDPSGGSLVQWDPVSTAMNVKADIQPLSSADRMVFGQRMLYVTHHIYCEQNLGLKRGDRITADTGQIFITKGFYDTAGRGRLYVIEAREQL